MKKNYIFFFSTSFFFFLLILKKSKSVFKIVIEAIDLIHIYWCVLVDTFLHQNRIELLLVVWVKVFAIIWWLDRLCVAYFLFRHGCMCVCCFETRVLLSKHEYCLYWLLTGIIIRVPECKHICTYLLDGTHGLMGSFG